MKNERTVWPALTAGVCYYPEHWPRAMWEEDLDRILAAGLQVVRVGEFAWSFFEPEENVFQYDFFDDFLELCARRGVRVILGTPTATPPAWLTERYPEVLNATREGVLYRHGSRRHYNYSSVRYQELCERIVTKLAVRYGHHPALIGWQIDNELNCELDEFCSEADTKAFRSWLRERYRTLDALNEAWGTRFWNQGYTSWDQIHAPRPVVNHGVNPHYHLDVIRFISDQTLAFAELQAKILRKYSRPGVFVTTNGMFRHMDNHALMRRCLDVYTYDSYPNFAYALADGPTAGDALRDRRWSMFLAETRSVCPHFGIMEQQSGAGSWTTRMDGPAPHPGQLSLWALQSVAHGADYVSFFRWRTCTFGTEIYWHGILDYDNRDNRRLAEVREFCEKLAALQPVCGSEYAAAFAVLRDYDNEWDSDVDNTHRAVHQASLNGIFETAELWHTPMDYVYLEEGTGLEALRRYPVLIYPHPSILTEERAELLKDYVAEGGVLVIGCQSGYKDVRGHCVMTPQPGLLAQLTGSDVREFTYTRPKEPIRADFDGEAMEMPVYNDALEALPGAKVLAVYANGDYAGRGALIENRYKKGRALQLGSAFSRENTAQLLRYLGVLEPFAGWVEAPAELEVVVRKAESGSYLFLLNYEAHPVTCTLKREMRSVFSGEMASGETELRPYEVQCYQMTE